MADPSPYDLRKNLEFVSTKPKFLQRMAGELPKAPKIGDKFAFESLKEDDFPVDDEEAPCVVILDPDLVPQNSKLKVDKPAEISVQSDRTGAATDSNGRILYRSSVKPYPEPKKPDAKKKLFKSKAKKKLSDAKLSHLLND